MKKVIFTIHKNSDKTTTYIRVSEKIEDEDGFIANQTGFMEVSAEKADGIKAKLENGELGYEFSEDKNAQGNYDVTPVKVAAGNLVTNA